KLKIDFLLLHGWGHGIRLRMWRRRRSRQILSGVDSTSIVSSMSTPMFLILSDAMRKGWRVGSPPNNAPSLATNRAVRGPRRRARVILPISMKAILGRARGDIV